MSAAKRAFEAHCEAMGLNAPEFDDPRQHFTPSQVLKPELEKIRAGDPESIGVEGTSFEIWRNASFLDRKHFHAWRAWFNDPRNVPEK